MIEIMYTIYIFTALVTFVYALADKNVKINGKVVGVFMVMSIVWPILWLLYVIDDRE